MTSADFDRQVGSTTLIFNAIIVGVAVISLVVGGLSVINTMAMSVTERTREIGVKRAIGGSRRRIIRELVAEAGAHRRHRRRPRPRPRHVRRLRGQRGRPQLGDDPVRPDPRAPPLFAVAFSTILGMVAGIVPAWNAARLDPVAALRYE